MHVNRPLRTRVGMVVLAAVMVGLAACGGDDDDGDAAGTSTSIPTTSSATTTTAALVGYDRPGEPEEVGTGFVVGTTLDGSAAYVEEADDEFDQIGCEGQPEPVLFRLPLDPARGEREVLGTPPPVRGSLVRGEGGRVALIDACEGFLSRVWVGREEPSGRLSGLQQLDLGRADGGPSLNPNSIAWSVDGRYLLASANPLNADAGESPVVRIDPGTGAQTELFDVGAREGVFQVGQLEDGTYVVAADGKVTLRAEDGTVNQTVDNGNGFSIAPDGESVAVYGRNLVLTAAGSTTPTVLARGRGQETDEISSATFSPDGRAVAFTRRDGSENSVEVVTVGIRSVTQVVDGGPYGRTFFTGDSRALVFNRFQSEPEFRADVLVVRFGD